MAGIGANDSIVSTSDLTLSVVIPALNEEAWIGACIESVWACGGNNGNDCSDKGAGVEVIVVDGGSKDDTVEVARDHGAAVISSPIGRAMQMNAGAQRAKGDALVFLHADSKLPPRALTGVRQALADAQVVGGSFACDFGADNSFLKLYSSLTRLPFSWLRFGDQAFFVRRSVFDRMNGYRPLPIMEDVDFFDRLRKEGRVQLVPQSVSTSARRFRQNGVVRQQLRNVVLVGLFRCGVRPERLAGFYPLDDEWSQG